MLVIKKIIVNEIGENCYIVSDETRNAIIIDYGAFNNKIGESITTYLQASNLSLKHSIFTHGHFDHVSGANYIYQHYGLKPEISGKDLDLLLNLSTQFKSILNIEDFELTKIQIPPIGRLLAENDEIKFGNHSLKVIETPGHTPGGLCFYCEQEKVLFSGDSLFEHSIGRTDFPGGNYNDLVYSLKIKIITLPDSVVVYPGHGENTTILNEKRNNPFLK